MIYIVLLIAGFVALLGILKFGRSSRRTYKRGDDGGDVGSGAAYHFDGGGDCGGGDGGGGCD